MIARYGIDAPGLVAGFLIAGIGMAALGLGLWVWGDAVTWVAVLGAGLGVCALYPLGMFCLMLHDSLITKLRHGELALDLAGLRGSEAVLDVGCGRGMMLIGAARRLTSGRAVGIDLWRAGDQARNRADQTLANAADAGVAGRVTVQTADMRQMPFEDACFDVILSSWAVHNLEAVEDRASALAEMDRVLAPGGRIVLIDIAFRHEYAAMFRALGLRDVAIVVPSVPRDWVVWALSFGSYAPVMVTARKTP